MLTFNEYQTRAVETAIYPESTKEFLQSRGISDPDVTKAFNLAYCGLGLGEAGEAQNKIKKIFRDDNFTLTPEKRSSIIKELGGLQWYIANLAAEIGVNLDEIAQTNLDELASRKARNTLKGSGDNR